jgi:hypothetical protein
MAAPSYVGSIGENQGGNLGDRPQQTAIVNAKLLLPERELGKGGLIQLQVAVPRAV